MLSINFKSIFGGLKARPGRRSTNDWVMFLLVITFLFIVFVIYHGYLFFGIQSDSTDVVVSTGNQVDTIDRDALSKTIEYLNRRVTGVNTPIEQSALPSSNE